MSYALADLERRVANLVRVGIIGTLSAGTATATVVIEDDNGQQLATDPRPWLTGRAGPDADWHTPEPGEQMVLLSPNGDMAQGVILTGLYSDRFPAPADSADIWRKKFKDGTVIEYDRAAHLLTVNVGDGTALVVANVATVDANTTTCTGDLIVEKNLTVLAHSHLNGGFTAEQGADGKAAMINGGLHATDDVTAGDISLKYHKTRGIKRGQEVSDGPQ